MPTKRIWRFTLSTQVVLAFVLGAQVGLVCGEKSTLLQNVVKVFIAVGRTCPPVVPKRVTMGIYNIRGPYRSQYGNLPLDLLTGVYCDNFRCETK